MSGSVLDLDGDQKIALMTYRVGVRVPQGDVKLGSLGLGSNTSHIFQRIYQVSSRLTMI